MRYTILLFILITLITSCGNYNTSGKIEEGVIKYDIKYFQSEAENPIISLLPTSMTYKFKDDNISQRIEGWMGIFHMAAISIPKKDENTALLKILNKKYLYQSLITNGKSFGYDEMPGMKITLVNDSIKTIAGYKCHKAIVSFSDTTKTPFDIFYTNDIELKNPNRNNPFREIDGVLLQYQMCFQNIRMLLAAKKIEGIEIPDEAFEVPDGYETVNREIMQKTINDLM